MSPRSSWTQERHDTLMRLRDQGESFTEIGRRLGISKQAAQGRWYRFTGAYEKRIQRVRGVSTVNDTGARKFQDLKPAKYPFAPDSSCPEFANDDDHCAKVLAEGGFPVLAIRRAA